jgi:transcriptional regulator with XRE-family HTH domain
MKRIKELRNKLNMSGEKLGQAVGVQKSAISKYERGEIEPSKDVLVLIANVLSTSVDYLLERTTDPAPPQKEKPADIGELDEDIKELISIQVRLDPEKRKELLNFAKFQLNEQNQ